MLEEAVGAATRDEGGSLSHDAEVSGGMGSERQQIVGESDRGSGAADAVSMPGRLGADRAGRDQAFLAFLACRAPAKRRPASGGCRRGSPPCRTTSPSSIGRVPPPALVDAQGQRPSHEEGRERRQTGVRHGVFAITRRALELVGETGADFAQLPVKLLNGAQPALDLDQGSSPRTKENHCGVGDQSINPQHVAYRTLVIARCNPERDSFARTCLGLRFRWFIRYMTEVCPRSSAG
jgi:hypothetical protein